jgi:hypothetical protein
MENHGCECSIILWASDSEFSVNVMQLCEPLQSKGKESCGRDPYNWIAFKEAFCLNGVSVL